MLDTQRTTSVSLRVWKFWSSCNNSSKNMNAKPRGSVLKRAAFQNNRTLFSMIVRIFARFSLALMLKATRCNGNRTWRLNLLVNHWKDNFESKTTATRCGSKRHCTKNPLHSFHVAQEKILWIWVLRRSQKSFCTQSISSKTAENSGRVFCSRVGTSATWSKSVRFAYCCAVTS